MTPWWKGNKKYVDQTHDSLLFVWRPQSWLALNFTAIKSKFYNFWWPSRGLTSNPCHYTYICFLGRNLDSRTTMLRITRHSEYIIHESPLFHEFSRFTLCLTVNSRITRNPFQTLCFVSLIMILLALYLVIAVQ